MYCLFLGIAKWIVKRLWIDGGVLTPQVLKIVQKRMNEFKVPSDLGRIPGKIDSGEGFSNFTGTNGEYFLQYMQRSLFGNIFQKMTGRFLYIL